MVLVGTKPLERKGSRINGIGALLAASTLPLASPNATHNHVTAAPIKMMSARTPNHSTTDAPLR